MKKNRMLRMASVLLVLTLLTTSIVGGTFAKYVTVGSVKDTARVAKWGVVINTSGSLFSDAYAKANAPAGTGDNLPAAWTANNNTLDNGISVAAETVDNNIVAPGTKSYGNGLSFGISGTPEVAVTVATTIKAEDIFLAAGTYAVLVPATVSDAESLKKVMGTGASVADVYAATTTGSTTTYEKVNTYIAGKEYYVLTNKVTVGDGGYYPVVYTLSGTTKNDGTTDSKTAVKVAEKLATAVDGTTTGATDYKATYTGSKNFNANTNLGTAGPAFGDEKLSWEWKFADGDKDKEDTILGDLIAARGETVGYVVVSVDDAATGAVTALTIKKDTNDFTVIGKNDAVVANLRTLFDISLTVTQVD